MPLAPELSTMPDMAFKFFRSGLAVEIINDMLHSDRHRNLCADAERLLQVFGERKNVDISGLDNITGGCILAVNHPNMDILFPAALSLFIKIRDEKQSNVRVLMASEILLTTNFNDKTAVPGSIALMRRFHKVYEESIISTPTVGARKDFVNGRAVAARKMIEAIKSDEMVFIAPEGHTEFDDVISPINTFHEGTGQIARLASRMNIPTVPVSVWSDDRKDIKVNIGTPFYPDSREGIQNAIMIMRKVAQGLPLRLRGPFENPNA